MKSLNLSKNNQIHSCPRLKKNSKLFVNVTSIRAVNPFNCKKMPFFKQLKKKRKLLSEAY